MAGTGKYFRNVWEEELSLRLLIHRSLHMCCHIRLIAIATLTLIALLAPADAHAAFSPTDVFTYQGRLDENGVPKTGTVDLRFDAFAQDTGGSPLNLEALIHDGVPLVNGVFTVQVSFGRRFFTGAPIFVQVGVREDAAGDQNTLTGFTNLLPRQTLTATPFANYSELAASVDLNSISSGQIANGSVTASDANTTSTTDGLQRRVFSGCGTNAAIRTINADGTVECDSDDVGAGAAAWGLTGNSGTDPATNFIGTIDVQPLVFRVGNATTGRLARAFGSDPATEFGINIVWGEANNSVSVGATGATIAGGGGRIPFYGNLELFNTVSGDFGTVGGGGGNQASAVATVAGGARNIASGSQSTISGGQTNTASGNLSTIGGGLSNTASGNFSVVSGGRGNAAVGVFAQSPGGRSVTAGGDHSFAAGNHARVRGRAIIDGVAGTGEPITCDDTFGSETCGDEGTFLWADSLDRDFVSQGSNQFLIRAAGGFGIQRGSGLAGDPSEFANVPEALLHVFQGSAGAAATADQNSVAVFESNGSAFISLLAPASGLRGVLFGEAGDNADGGIIYNPDNSLHLRANGDVTRLAIEGDGSVGIGTGTAAVSNALHVTGGGTGALPGGHVVQLQNAATSTTNNLLALKSALTGNVGSATNFITFFDGDNDANGAIEGNGAGGVVYKTSGADYAEWLPRIDASETIAPGDLVGLHAGGRVSKRLEGALQVLIASTGAAVAGNSPGENEQATHTLTAFVGQVHARVCGSVRAGDAIVANEDGSGCGTARDPKQLAAHEFARVAGTAWESAAGEGEHRVRVAVGLGGGGAERASMLARIDALEATLSTQQALVDALLAREARAVVTSAR